MADRPLTQQQPPQLRTHGRIHVEFDEHGEITEYRLHETWEQYQRGLKAMRLAPTLDIYHALLRGESVDINNLDPKGIARYGLKPDTPLRVIQGGRR